MSESPPVPNRQPRAVENAAEFEEILRGSPTASPTLIQYSAPWCPRCPKLKDQIAESLDGSVPWLYVDIEDAQDLVLRNNIGKLPRVDLYHRGRMTTVEGAAATLEGVQKLLAETQTELPSFELDDDF